MTAPRRDRKGERQRAAKFDLPVLGTRSLRVVVERAAVAGETGPLAALEIREAGGVRRVDLPALTGESLLPIVGGGCRLTIRFAGVDGG